MPGTDMGAAQLLNRETRSRARTPWGLSPLLTVPVMMEPFAVTAPQTLSPEINDLRYWHYLGRL